MTALLTVLLLAGVVGAAFCAGAETGFLLVDRARLAGMVGRGTAGARSLSRAVSDMSRTLTTLLIGNNLSSVTVSTVSTVLAARFFADSAAGAALWSAGVTLAVVFAGEYWPKLAFASKPVRRSLRIARAYNAVAAILSPAVAVFQFAMNRLFKARSPRSARPTVSRDTLRFLVSDRESGARLTPFERKLIGRVLALQTRFARDVMVPRERLDVLRVGFTPAEAMAVARASMHVLLPVLTDDGKAVCVLNVMRGEMLKPFWIDAAMRADDIIPLMRRHRSRVALVTTGKEGELLGLLTEDDVLSALLKGLK